MIDDKDILRTATVLLKSRGDNAEVVAAQYIDERLAHSDLVGRDVWRQVLAAIKELRRTTRQRRMNR